MPCEEWSRILERYRGAVNAYDEAVHNLAYAPGAAFNETWHRAERARKQSDKCRADLLHHEHDHGCLGAAPAETTPQLAAVGADEYILGDQGQFGG